MSLTVKGPHNVCVQEKSPQSKTSVTLGPHKVCIVRPHKANINFLKILWSA